MRVFGSECYAYKQNKQKLDPRCRKGIFLGYDKESPAYLLYIPETGKVMKYTVVTFPTTRKGVEQHTQTEIPLPDDDDDLDLMPTPHSVSDVDRSEKVPDRLAEQPQAESETSPTCQPPDKGFRRSTRTRRPPAYLSDYVTDMEDDDQVLTSVDYCYKSFAFPQTYQEAMDSPESSNWKAAMEEEMNLKSKITHLLCLICQRAKMQLGVVGRTLSKKVPLVLKLSKLGMLLRVTAK